MPKNNAINSMDIEGIDDLWILLDSDASDQIHLELPPLLSAARSVGIQQLVEEMNASQTAVVAEEIPSSHRPELTSSIVPRLSTTSLLSNYLALTPTPLISAAQQGTKRLATVQPDKLSNTGKRKKKSEKLEEKMEEPRIQTTLSPAVIFREYRFTLCGYDFIAKRAPVVGWFRYKPKSAYELSPLQPIATKIQNDHPNVKFVSNAELPIHIQNLKTQKKVLSSVEAKDYNHLFIRGMSLFISDVLYKKLTNITAPSLTEKTNKKITTAGKKK